MRGVEVKVAMLVNHDNFERYSKWKDCEWELVHLGSGAPDCEKVIDTKATVLVVDAIMNIGAEIIENMPGLKLIHSQGVAYNAIDIRAAQKAGIYVCNNAGVNARAVAELTVMLMLTLLKNFRWNEDMVYAGKQIEVKNACFGNGLPELGDQKIGLVGCGAIGYQLASMLKPFGCELFYYDAYAKTANPDMTFIPLEELYACCDIVSLHVPVTPETTNMINDRSLQLFKRGALLINTARGELLDHEAVVRALKSGQLSGFGTDTLAPEPVLSDNPFLRALPEEIRRRVSLSPHIGGLTAGSYIRTYEHIRKNIEAVERGERPDCVVNGL